MITTMKCLIFFCDLSAMNCYDYLGKFFESKESIIQYYLIAEVYAILYSYEYNCIF